MDAEADDIDGGRAYGGNVWNKETFVQELINEGYEDVQLIQTDGGSVS